jgi:hypothetical protein
VRGCTRSGYGASKEKEVTLSAEKEAEPLKEAARVPKTAASEEGDAMPVPMAGAKDDGKDKLPSPGEADPEV